MRYPHSLLSLALTVALAGCQAQGLVGVGAGGATPGGQQAATPGSTATRLGAFEFKQLSAEAAAQLAGRASGAATMEAAAGGAVAAPVAARGSADAAMSVMPGSPYAHGTFFSGPYGPMKLESATEARGSGSAGGWADIKAQVVAPVLADWTNDARLIASHGTLDAEGNTAQGTERWPGELGWRATYAAPGLNEVLEFHVTAVGSTITRLRWAPVDLNLDAAGIDAKAALATIGAALGDAGARSEEDKLGHDYFFGKDGGGVGIFGGASGGIAVAVAEPAVMPMPVDVGGAPIAAPTPGPTPRPVFELKAGGRWNASLNAIGDKVVWELHYDPGEQAWQPPVGGWSTDPSAYGMVDAASGALIRFRRPSQYFVGEPGESPEPRPMTRPASVPATEPSS